MADDEREDPREVARLRYHLYVEALRARMPQPPFELLMTILRLWLENGGGTASLQLDDEEKALFTAEVRQELLTLMGLIGATQPGHEDRADHVVVPLGDGEHVKGAMTLVPADIAADPDQLRSRLADLDAQQRQRTHDHKEVEAIARASGMRAADPDGGP
ncbi:hypothetical protein [Streptomyces sp. NPDC047014]|uniref:hypothetical protein n=1 Tax=Streptomyces sp. NPDC047014 TaxID=3155736 RepID=UPI0033CB9CE7